MAEAPRAPSRRRRSRPAPDQVIGWREWAALPELAIPAIKVKVDTGARSSSLHAVNVEIFRDGGAEMVRFMVHPRQRSSRQTVKAVAPLADQRWVRSSGGHETLRPVIETEVALGAMRFSVELTLVGRQSMGFRMLLGRQALKHRFLVNAGRSYLFGREPAVPAP